MIILSFLFVAWLIDLCIKAVIYFCQICLFVLLIPFMVIFAILEAIIK